MPEGPEIRRAADNLEAAIKGKPLTDVWFANLINHNLSVNTLPMWKRVVRRC